MLEMGTSAGNGASLQRQHPRSSSTLQWWLNQFSYFLHVGKQAEGGHARTNGNSAMPNGNSWNQSCGPDDAPMAGVAPGRTHERCSTGFYGSWVRGRSGANCPRNIRRTRRAIAVFSSGCGRANWSASCMSWRRSCRPAEDCNWRRLSSTPPSREQKRGPRGRAHQTWQRDENHRSRR